MFDYDWFYGPQFREQCEQARTLCARRRFPELDPDTIHQNGEYSEFWESLRTRTLVYLRDGFSYEFKDFVDVMSKSHLTFECEPVDEQYKVGAFVVSVPFEDIVRIEVFAVPPDEMPVDMPSITGFRARTEPQTPPMV